MWYHNRPRENSTSPMSPIQIMSASTGECRPVAATVRNHNWSWDDIFRSRSSRPSFFAKMIVSGDLVPGLIQAVAATCFEPCRLPCWTEDFSREKISPNRSRNLSMSASREYVVSRAVGFEVAHSSSWSYSDSVSSLNSISGCSVAKSDCQMGWA